MEEWGYSHWLSPGPGPGPEPGRMGCIVITRTFHTAPEREQGPEQGQGRMRYIPIFRRCVLVIFNDFQVSSPGPRHSHCEWFLHNIGPGPCPGTEYIQNDYIMTLFLT